MSQLTIKAPIMLTRLVAKRSERPRWPRLARFVALLAAGTLLTDFSLAAPLSQRSRAARAKDSHAALPNVTYTGFRLLNDGRAIVYVELTRKVAVTVQKQKNLIIYELEGAQVTLKNNRNPLITRQFATILESARLVVVKPARAGRGKRAPQVESTSPRVQLLLRLREDVTPTHTLSERASGAVLEITLPAAGASGSKS